jgi:hypothetical protein
MMDEQMLGQMMGDSLGCLKDWQLDSWTDLRLVESLVLRKAQNLELWLVCEMEHQLVAQMDELLVVELAQRLVPLKEAEWGRNLVMLWGQKWGT